MLLAKYADVIPDACRLICFLPLAGVTCSKNTTLYWWCLQLTTSMSLKWFTHAIGYECISLDDGASPCLMFHSWCAETTSNLLRPWLMQDVVGWRSLANACTPLQISPCRCPHATCNACLPYIMLLAIERYHQVDACRPHQISPSRCTHATIDVCRLFLHVVWCCLFDARMAQFM